MPVASAFFRRRNRVRWLALLCLGAVPAFAGPPAWVKALPPAPERLAPQPGEHHRVVFHERTLAMKANGEAELVERRAVRLLDDSSSDERWYSVPASEHASSKRIEGWRVRADGEVESLSRKRQAVFNSSRAAYLNDFDYRSAWFETVEPGDLVCFEGEMELQGWADLYLVFALKKSEAVESCRLRVEWPEGWSLRVAESGLEGFVKEEGPNWIVWEGTNLPWREPVARDPGAELDGEVRLQFDGPATSRRAHFDSWSAISGWTETSYAEPTRPDEGLRTLAATLLAASTDFEDSLRALAEHVTTNVRYVAREIGWQRWIPKPAAETAELGYGDCKEKAALLNSLCLAAGFDAAPVLVRTDRRVMPAFPSPFQFNHVIAAVSLQGRVPSPGLADACSDGWFYVDPTAEVVPFGQLPPALNGLGCVGRAGVDALVPLPDSDAGHPARLGFSGRLRMDGSARADVSVEALPVNTERSLAGLRACDAADAADRMRRSLAGLWREGTADSARVAPGSPARLDFVCEAQAALGSAGGLRALRLLPTLPEFPVELGPDRPPVPIRFPARHAEYRFDWTFPPGFGLVEAPAPFEAACGPHRISLEIERRESGLGGVVRLDLVDEDLPADSLDGAMAFERNLQRLGRLLATLADANPAEVVE